ncbi:MobF family relaxase [Microbacterium sp. 2FI]|uniref:MobF family relaxase n=1 Tax=Microbacterium sp. 2FI TaxID=2502193 RepID=UPI00201676C2|nr:MobF family relaxase [Microbacterium sp. 2FI]
MSAGDGYKYLLRSVAAGDGNRPLSTPLTRYYAAEGTPPGRWMGSGLRGLAGGEISEGDTVAEGQLQLLIGMGRDPNTGEALGRAFPQYGAAAAGESTQSPRRAVAGYDLTFSIPKSASVLWGIADAATQSCIADAHHRAVAQLLDYVEREVAATRTGATTRDGAVAQVDVTGVVATAFDHFDSRAGDPHLHTHVVISNKVQTALDGKWRSLDGRPMHASVVALSELHEALFADELARTLGLDWEARDRGRDRNATWAIATVPESLVAEFSTRARHIDVETDRLIDGFVLAHGHRPDASTIMKLRAQATLMTRPPKEVRSLAVLTAEWRDRASAVLQTDATTWAHGAAQRQSPELLRAEAVPLDAIDALGNTVVNAVSDKRTTWTRWNLTAEAARQTMGVRFAAASDREAVVGMIVDAAERRSVRLTPPELATSPLAFRRADDSTVFRPRGGARFTSTALLDAEARLIELASDMSGPHATETAMRHGLHHRLPDGSSLTTAQASALTAIAGSPRVLDVLVGPAGAGKTTAMIALRRAWEREHGSGSVVGLAPSAAAAHVLAEDLAIATENTAKWWQNHLVRGETFRSGQLVIIDEASLASTLSLDRICGLAARAGAKVLLVGDHAQLQSVGAGGAFSLLVHARPDAPELVDIHRFIHAWEKPASLLLRDGDPDAIDDYLTHDRLRQGEHEEMMDAAYAAWRSDIRAGLSTVLVTDSREAVAALNTRARADLIIAGVVDATRQAGLHDDTQAAVGDTVITRRNERHLQAGRSWVRNGDRWTVVGVHDDGALSVRRHGQRWGSSTVLPAGYVADHVELGYAVTAHRAQGITTDTVHVLIDGTTTRENLYVAMTRGRRANVAYVAVDRPDPAHEGPHPGDSADASARGVLNGVLQNVGAELSAHETLTAEQDAWGSIAQLAAEYETIASVAQHDRWVELVRSSGLTEPEAAQAVASDAFGPLSAEMRRAEAHHLDIESVLPRLVRARSLTDAEDVAAVLQSRVARAISRSTTGSGARRSPRLVVGLIPVALGPMDDDMRVALQEREQLMEARAEEFVVRAVSAREPWIRELGEQPRGAAAESWQQHARVVAAYRDRYGIVGRRVLGASPASTHHERDAARARAAMEHARRISRSDAAQQSRTGRRLERSGLAR